MPKLYEELRNLAAAYLRYERPDHTLQPTALVHEAYSRLAGSLCMSWNDRAHFLALAANAMRRVLVDHARRHRAAKRGGNGRRELLDEQIVFANEPSVDILALHEALDKLSRIDERQSKVVELRFFGGLRVNDVAEVLSVSPRTVELEWSMAKGWLKREISRGNAA